jgi:hypothetical protein
LADYFIGRARSKVNGNSVRYARDPHLGSNAFGVPNSTQMQFVGNRGGFVRERTLGECQRAAHE